MAIRSVETERTEKLPDYLNQAADEAHFALARTVGPAGAGTQERDLVLELAVEVHSVAKGETVSWAFNGTYDGQSNSISGSVTVGGTAVPLADPRLNPDFDQDAFDATYACTPDLVEPVPAQ